MVFAPATSGIAFTRAHADGRSVAVGIDVDAVFTWALQREGQIRRVDLKIVAAFEAAHRNVHRTLRQLYLHGAIVEIQEGDARLAADANGRAPDVQFAARISVGPKIIADRKRAIGIRLHPIGLTARLERDRSLDIVEARHSSWGIVVRPCGRRKRKNKSGKKNQNGNEENSFSHGCCASDLRSFESRASTLILLLDRMPDLRKGGIPPILH